MDLKRLLLSFPLRRQTVIGALLVATVLFIVYQFTFVAELSESSRQQNLRNGEGNNKRGESDSSKQLYLKNGEGNLIDWKSGHLSQHKLEDQILSNHDKTLGKDGLHKRDNKINHGDTEKKIEMKKEKNKHSEDLKQTLGGLAGKKVHANQEKEKTESKKVEGNLDASKMFKCTASGKEIHLDKVNDDYCDCPEDGSDEPRTNACTNGKFSCLKHMKRSPKSIPSAWVNDGVCDCCDGSDEWKKLKIDEGPSVDIQRKVGRYLSPCPDLCIDGH